MGPREAVWGNEGEARGPTRVPEGPTGLPRAKNPAGVVSKRTLTTESLRVAGGL